MSVKCPSNWRVLLTYDNGDPCWYRRVCGNYEARRVPTMSGLASEALYTPHDGPAVSLGVFGSMPMAMAECREHLNEMETAK